MDENQKQPRPTLEEILRDYPWANFESHLNDLRERVDNSITKTNGLRSRYREELLSQNPDIRQGIKRPSANALESAEKLLTLGTVAASDGTISSVPLLGGSKIQVFCNW